MYRKSAYVMRQNGSLLHQTKPPAYSLSSLEKKKSVESKNTLAQSKSGISQESEISVRREYPERIKVDSQMHEGFFYFDI